MNVDAGRDRLLAIVHHRAGEIAEPGLIQIEVDEQNGQSADDAARHPRRRKSLAQKFDGTSLDFVADEDTRNRGNRAAKLIAGNRSFTGAEGDGRHSFDDLRKTEEKNERQHFRIFGAQEPWNQEVIEREANDHEHSKRDHDRGNWVERKEREQPERQESAQH